MYCKNVNYHHDIKQNLIIEAIEQHRDYEKLSKIYGKNEELNGKIYNNYRFKKYSDEELNQNIDNYLHNIKDKLKICFDINCKNNRCQNICIIYSNKKVGSTSLWGSMNLFLSSKFTIFHFHSEVELENMGIFNLTIMQFINILKKYNKKVIIIDIYRPIFDHCLSVFFHELLVEFQSSFEDIKKYITIETIMSRFRNLFPFYIEQYNCDYFMEKYGIENSYSKFDFKNKHLYFKDGTVDFIKLRLCDALNWNIILKKYIGEEIYIINHNLTENKPIGDLYNTFKAQFLIPKNYYEVIKQDKYFLFYYSQEDQEQYLKKFNNLIDEREYVAFSKIQFITYNFIKYENASHLKVMEEGMKTNFPIVNNCICNICRKNKEEFYNKFILEINRVNSKNIIKIKPFNPNSNPKLKNNKLTLQIK